MNDAAANIEALRERYSVGECLEFSFHDLVRLALPKSFPHARALRREIEPFEVAATGEWDILVTEPKELAGCAAACVEVLDTGRLSEKSVVFLVAGDTVVVGCGRDPVAYYLLPVEWLLLLKGASLVHAAGVEVKGQGVLLPAVGGVGKTAAVKALCRAGGAFLGDDLIIVSHNAELFSYPKPLFLYPYHQALFPHVFERKRKFVVPPWLTRPVAAVRKRVRPLLRPFPRLEDFARRYTPEHLHTPVREALPDVEVVSRAPLALTLFLERSPRAEANLAPMEKSELVAKMAAILHAELPEPARQALTACSAAGQIPLRDFFGRMESVLSRAVASAPAYRLEIPDSYRATETASLVEEKVAWLLGSRAKNSESARPA
ncbi:MAG: hypothetical protein ACRD35_05320 [Candidatus Acidiferrales bacterium]